MPAPMRNIRPDMAAKLSQLEEGAAGFERDAKNAVSAAALFEHRREWAREVLRDLTLRAWMRPVWIAYRSLRAALATLARTVRHPELAAAARFSRGWFREGAPYLAMAGAVMLVIVLMILLLAPPD